MLKGEKETPNKKGHGNRWSIALSFTSVVVWAKGGAEKDPAARSTGCKGTPLFGKRAGAENRTVHRFLSAKENQKPTPPPPPRT